MIEVAPAVEDHFGNTLVFRTLGDESADFLRALDVSALAALAQGSVKGRGGSQRVAGVIVYHLGIDMINTAEHIQAWSIRASVHLGPHAAVPLLAQPNLLVHP